ncbi:MFS transporter [Pseudonocardia cypriaca]|uniref:Putative MFS family arabinose efflux permease n=1 Tax=Pseudonocardia cypriaca TaxID=882449 RepID=A0A543FUC5_9PSEU|nr:MFS transporter [Pseudonocardia cypriaca]TQM37435.1 putative MFS family arabinose efflux permease [Pseudonocardia cypriaca]
MTSRGPTHPRAAVGVVTLALVVDMFLYGSLVPLLPVLPAVAGSSGAAGLLFAAYAVAMLVATPVVGRWVDRSGPRAPLLAGLVALAAATALFAAVVDVPGAAGLTVLSLARAAQGVAAAASWSAGLALIASTHPPERRGTVMGLALSAIGVGVLLGPAVSGFLADAFGPRAPFVLVAVLAAADAVARMIWIRPTAAAPASVPLRVVARGPRAGLLIGLTALGAAAIAFAEPVLPLHLSALGLGSTGIGLVFGAAALLGGLAAPLAGIVTDRLGAPRVAALGTLVAAAGFVLCGMPAAAASIAGVLVVGIGAQLVLAPTLVLIGALAEHIQPPAYGAAYALYNLAYTAGLAVAPLAAGTAAALAGVAATTIAAAAVAALTGLWLLLPSRTSAPPTHPVNG